jgi:hypothetical protein
VEPRVVVLKRRVFAGLFPMELQREADDWALLVGPAHLSCGGGLRALWVVD